MPVTVRIPAPLRPVVGGASTVDCTPGTVRELIDQLDAQHAGFRTVTGMWSPRSRSS